jgi:hypothetical protein
LPERTNIQLVSGLVIIGDPALNHTFIDNVGIYQKSGETVLSSWVGTTITLGDPAGDQYIQITDTEITLVAAAGVLSIDADGISIEASGSYSVDRAYTFHDGSGDVWGVYGRFNSLEQEVQIRNNPTGSRDGVISFFSESGTGDAIFRVETSVNEIDPALFIIQSVEGSPGRSEIFMQVDKLELNRTALVITSLNHFPATPQSHHIYLYSDDDGGDDVEIYFKSPFLVYKYDDAGTTRYKYLDMSGTGVTWVHSTVAP